MATILDARNLSLKDVHRLLGVQEHFNSSISSLLSLEASTEEQLLKIRHLFHDYYAERKISEGQVKFLFISPLLWLSGFYQSNIKITLKENISDIFIEDEDTVIKGRMDILAVNKNDKLDNTYF